MVTLDRNLFLDPMLPDQRVESLDSSRRSRIAFRLWLCQNKWCGSLQLRLFLTDQNEL
jgi:hypothetical protein